MMNLLQAADYRPPQVAAQGSEGCERCGRLRCVCVCNYDICDDLRRRILILQHPREQDVLLGTAPLLQHCLADSQRRIGLSWPSLAKALGEPAEPGRWAVLWPDRNAAPQGDAWARLSLRKRDCAKDTVIGLIVLDGTWSQAKALWWRNPWLLKCSRLTLQPREPSIYGRLRREPNKASVSTLEAVAEALLWLDEAPQVRQTLRRALRTMMQRLRDHKGRACT